MFGHHCMLVLRPAEIRTQDALAGIGHALRVGIVSADRNTSFVPGSVIAPRMKHISGDVGKRRQVLRVACGYTRGSAADIRDADNGGHKYSHEKRTHDMLL